MDKAIFEKVKRRDRAARIVITTGGIAIILSVIAILVLIVSVAIPLFLPPTVAELASFAANTDADKAVLAVGCDEYIEVVYSIDTSGRIRFYTADSGALLAQTEPGQARVPKPSPDARRIIMQDRVRLNTWALYWDDDRVSIVTIDFKPEFDEDLKRTIRPLVRLEREIEPGLDGARPRAFQIRLAPEDGALTFAATSGDKAFTVIKEVITESLLGEDTAEMKRFHIEAAVPNAVTAFTLDSSGGALYAGTDNGCLVHWALRPDGPVRRSLVPAFRDQRTISSIGIVYGDVSIAAGDETGGLSIWSPVLQSDASVKKLYAIHEALTPHAAEVVSLLPSPRNKGIYSLGADGTFKMDHVTTERELVRLAPPPTFRHFNTSPRGDGIVGVTARNRIAVYRIDAPHPETSLRTLFGPVWYESYNEPEFSWQSTAGTDDFEPKLSLVPLVFGTFKGTVYAMFFSVPLALLAAAYTSQFASHTAKKIVKPAVEVMAAVPSVVIGFLIALWLAPIVQEWLVGFFVSLFVLPATFLVFLGVWQLVRKNDTIKAIEKGHEFILLVPTLLLGVAISAWLSPVLEAHFFDNDVQLWLYDTFRTRYDQRNCIIIAFGLGFAVIPIIFSISEDALSSVPGGLSAASLALGASRWQTVWRVVLPSASPGIFAAIMIGFGRAVGETMIVLMATGNTAILDTSIFNGMRTLSANIAVEIPEAPVGGTLYRTLFLCAVLLFSLTFVLNTLAEVISHRMRKKYGQY